MTLYAAVKISRSLSRPSDRGRFLSFSRLVALGSVALGCMALVIAFAVLEGFDQTLRGTAAKFTSHIRVSAFGGRQVPNPDVYAKKIVNAGISAQSATPFVEKEGLLRFGGRLEGAVLKGTSIELEFAQRPKRIVAGKAVFSSDSAHELAMGLPLAQSLGCSVGSKVIATTVQQTGAGLSPTATVCTVAAIYETGMRQYDMSYVYMPVAAAAEAAGLPIGSASGFDVMLADPDQAVKAARTLEDLLGYPFYAVSIQELNANIFGWIELQRRPIPIVLGLITLVAMLNVATALLIAVVEKTYTIGVLRALGMSGVNVVTLFVGHGLSLGLVGTSVGCFLGYCLCLLQQQYKIVSLDASLYYLDAAPIAFASWHFAVVVGFSLALCILATAAPALVASRISPLRALRFR